MLRHTLLPLLTAAAIAPFAVAEKHGGEVVAAGAQDQLTLQLLPTTMPAPAGGRCLDGTMAGYYLHEGTDPDLFVIYLKGGGACYDEASCQKRAKSALGSSSYWATSMVGSGAFSADCTANPDFCEATHVFVPYCTGDCHAGNNTSPSASSWELYFDGHANFAAIIAELKQQHGLAAAKKVLLTGGSAGGIGTFKNVDFLATLLPGAVVKGAPEAGWFFPAALPTDLPNIYAPSDWAHFANGSHGNPSSVNNSQAAFVQGELWQSQGLYPPACVEQQKPNEWWACGSIDKWYKYIRSPLFVIENQYDSNQIFAQELVPDTPHDELVSKYIVMYGEAMRNSTAQVLRNAPLTKKPQPDGLFHPSCLAHGISATLNGTDSLTILGDWFFERGKMTAFYRLVESCPASANGLPCNPHKGCAVTGGGPSPPHPGPTPTARCVAALEHDRCSPSQGVEGCEQCGQLHRKDLTAAGCTPLSVLEFCKGTSPSPTPTPTPPSACVAALNKDGCKPDAGTKACEQCAGEHQSDLLKAGCTPRSVQSFCTGGARVNRSV